MRTANPALAESTFSEPRAASAAEAMTIQGTVQKTALLLAVLVAACGWTWSRPDTFLGPRLVGLIIAGLVIAIVTIAKKSWSGATAPLYAAVEGMILGVISAIFERSYPGIVFQAVLLTFGTLAALLAAYSSRLIPVTQNFRLGIVAATGGICLVYLAGLILGFFGRQIPLIHESGPVGILFSVFVVAIAALNLVLDFDFIEKGAQTGQPRYMEWYGAFGLLVTLIWLYLEILRLLAKSRSRRR
ncbi:MAG: Bax inhibitor-1/YccA family protein [Candidatus Omnitrophica bacterium]|nr:Bax inhibitor-1/YccA family protein [Candidatus Omnitrophota bacterium]